jgi:hypothetical protein
MYGSLPRRIEFDPEQACVEFVADKVQWDRLFSEYLDFH